MQCLHDSTEDIRRTQYFQKYAFAAWNTISTMHKTQFAKGAICLKRLLHLWDILQSYLVTMEGAISLHSKASQSVAQLQGSQKQP